MHTAFVEYVIMMIYKEERWVTIQPLKRIVESEDANGNQLTRLPNNAEMMNKINEIIRVVNKMESKKIDDLFKPRNSY